MTDLENRLIARARQALTPNAADESRVLAAVEKRLLLGAAIAEGAANGQRTAGQAQRNVLPRGAPRETSFAGQAGHSLQEGTLEQATGQLVRGEQSGGAAGRAVRGGASSGATGRAALSSQGWGALAQYGWLAKSLLGVAFLVGAGVGIGARTASRPSPARVVAVGHPSQSPNAAAAISGIRATPDSGLIATVVSTPEAVGGEAEPDRAPSAGATLAGADAARARSAGRASQLPRESAQTRAPRLARNRTRSSELAAPVSNQDLTAGRSLRPELEALQAAERALRGGEPARAFDVLQECERHVGAGGMREERNAVSTVARCAMSLEQRAEALASFLEAYPASAYTERVRRSCAQ